MTSLKLYVLRWAISLPRRLLRACFGPAIERDGRRFDIRLQALTALERLSGDRPLNEGPVARARQYYRQVCQTLDRQDDFAVSARDVTIDGPGGPIAVRLYRPLGGPARPPLLLHFHGGGFVIGDLESHATICRFMAAKTNAVVAAVDYRLAPEHPYPAALEDAMAVVRAWPHRAEAWGVSADRLALIGDSAGGGLAVSVARQMQTEGLPDPCLQVLIYPWLDMSLSHPSLVDLGRGFILTRDLATWFRDAYVGHLAPDALKTAEVSPFFIDDLHAMPPTLMAIAGFDPLRDEELAFAARLQAAGVATERVMMDEMAHGFWSFGGTLEGAAALQDLVATRLKAALHPG